ncbi:MAG: histidine kinase [Melioribacteraceae bacterium]
MNIYKHRKTNGKVGFFFSAFLATTSILNNIQGQTALEFDRIVINWSISLLFLLVIWFINSYLTLYFERAKFSVGIIRRIVIIVLTNTVLLSGFILIAIYILNEFNVLILKKENVYSFVIIKGFVSVLIIYVIQYALNSDARAQEISMQNQMLKTENIRSQFEALKQQINPHFLFNSLSVLRSMIRSDNKKSEEFVIKLSEIYRQLLLKKEKETVTLEEELAFINDYSFMLFARFENMLTIKIDLSETIMKRELPTFSLQLLLENCIKHNIISKEKPLSIKIFNTDSNSITMENDLQPKISTSKKSGYGLQNLIRRYNLLGYHDGVFIFSDENVFRVKLSFMDL